MLTCSGTGGSGSDLHDMISDNCTPTFSENQVMHWKKWPTPDVVPRPTASRHLASQLEGLLPSPSHNRFSLVCQRQAETGKEDPVPVHTDCIQHLESQAQELPAECLRVSLNLFELKPHIQEQSQSEEPLQLSHFDAVQASRAHELQVSEDCEQECHSSSDQSAQQVDRYRSCEEEGGLAVHTQCHRSGFVKGLSRSTSTCLLYPD